MIRELTIGAAMAGAMAAGAWAQDGGDDVDMVTGARSDRAPSIDQVDDVVIARGRRLDGFSFEEYTREFVTEIAKPVADDFGIARWNANDRLCVGAMNIPRDAAQYVVNRISDIAEHVGLGVDDPGCQADILILFTQDGQALARAMVDQNESLFRPFGGAGGTTAGLPALEAFANSDAPVRWWSVTMPVGWNGRPAIELPNTSGQSTSGFGGIPTTAGANSRVSNLIKDELWRTYVIVDAAQARGLDWSRLADYLAVVALAQIDPQADTSGYQTVLNLFEEPGSNPGLTAWDLSFLRALYEFDQFRPPRRQAAALADEMVRDQESAAE